MLLLGLCAASATFILASAEMALTDFNGIVMDQATGALSKLPTVKDEGWNAMVASVDSIEGPNSQRRGVSCKVASRGKEDHGFMVGLVHGTAVAQDPSWKTIIFAAQVHDCTFKVFESGAYRGHLGEAHAGDIIEVTLNSETPPKIEYRVNGQVRYTSRIQVQFPLFMKISAWRQGPLAQELTWINTSSKGEGSAPSSAPSSAERQAETCESNLRERVQKLEDELRAATKSTKEEQLELQVQRLEDALRAATKPTKEEQLELRVQGLEDALRAATKPTKEKQLELRLSQLQDEFQDKIEELREEFS